MPQGFPDELRPVLIDKHPRGLMGPFLLVLADGVNGPLPQAGDPWYPILVADLDKRPGLEVNFRLSEGPDFAPMHQLSNRNRPATLPLGPLVGPPLLVPGDLKSLIVGRAEFRTGQTDGSESPVWAFTGPFDDLFP